MCSPRPINHLVYRIVWKIYYSVLAYFVFILTNSLKSQFIFSWQKTLTRSRYSISQTLRVVSWVQQKYYRARFYNFTRPLVRYTNHRKSRNLTDCKFFSDKFTSDSTDKKSSIILTKRIMIWKKKTSQQSLYLLRHLWREYLPNLFV